jgi:hypothetical protein
MTRTISLIIATVGAALLFAVPAWGDNWGADKAQLPSGSPELAELLAAKNGTVGSSIAGSSSVTQRMLDARERSFGVVDTQQVNPLDARERSFATKQVAQPAPDWFERAAGTAVRGYRTPVVDDRFTIDPTAGPTVVTVSSGRDLELPQIGIGLGLGLVLALGLFLAMRYTRSRPLAH